MSRHIERGALPGAITLVSRHGEVHVDVLGTMDLGGDRPMRRDAIFRIASMTKPVVAVAALILVEECRLRLDDPVDPLLPELANRRVLTALDAQLTDTVPARRPITLRDLLTFRNGFGTANGASEEYPIAAAAAESGLAGGPPGPAKRPAPDEWLRRLGDLPLMAQPGEKWLYNTGSDILGILIARATGQPLEEFLRERIFEPLGMRGTGFSVPDADIGRLPTGYLADPGASDISPFDPALGGQWSRRPAFQSGSAGLLSTVDDYFAFATMLLSLGRHGQERILSRPTVLTMITDQLTPAQKAASGFFPGYFDNRGWGFGVSVITGRDELSGSPGRFGWDGGFGTSWWSDPAENLTGILLTQRGEFPAVSGLHRDFWTSVYQALDD
ncbi:serine hydrolase domain-containing protein [Amycolatopsis sp. RTGN1]|uniref:serine hydrolase domain-containing protein n=1 Tax=Amycolatopsis ponsaeliensis TaxID=2992142 RepID=UPI0025516682|nr:serine hydrolase domain-containing protein [Amycolatopsis sp. RTGN1]